MLYGGHVKCLEDIDFLRNQGFGLGEILLKSADARAYWRESGVRNGFHSEFLLIAHGPKEGPPNDPENLRQRYRPALEETIDTAAALDIGFLTIHLWMDPRFVKPEVVAEKLELLRRICRYGSDHRVVISLENLSESAVDLRPVLEAVPELALTLDVGHGQLLSGVNTSFGIIADYGGAIGHVHLHDNRGGTGVLDDLHLPIGEGIIDFPTILGALVTAGYDGTITLELERHDLYPSLERVKGYLRSLTLHQDNLFSQEA